MSAASAGSRRRTIIAIGVLVALAAGALLALLIGTHRGSPSGHPATPVPTISGGTIGTPAAGAPPASTLSVSATLAGPIRSVVDFLGFNGENTRDVSAAWLDPRFAGAVQALGPESIRVFGGTTANFWNWQTGTFTETASSPGIIAGHPVPPMPLSVWAADVQAAGAVAVFDLNIVTDSLTDQLAMLHTAAGLGLPIRWVELGNELYVKTAANRSAFPSGAAYGRLATTWIAAIKAAFPDARVAVCGYSYLGGSNPWNASLLSTVRGEDAITFHTYWNPAPAGAAGGSPLDSLLVATQRRFANVVAHDLPELPPGVAAWVTEWNVAPDTKVRIGGTWAQGLSQVLYAMDLLSAPSVELTDNHSLIAWNDFAAIFAQPGGVGSRSHPGTPFALTADGEALRPLLAALRNHGTGQALSFSPDPQVAAGVPALMGWSFGDTAALLNLSGASVTVTLPGSLTGKQADEVSADPASRVTGPGSCQVDRGTAGTTLVLPPYAVAELS